MNPRVADVYVLSAGLKAEDLRSLQSLPLLGTWDGNKCWSYAFDILEDALDDDAELLVVLGLEPEVRMTIGARTLVCFGPIFELRKMLKAATHAEGQKITA